jgi:hypothetical protein
MKPADAGVEGFGDGASAGLATRTRTAATNPITISVSRRLNQVNTRDVLPDRQNQINARPLPTSGESKVSVSPGVIRSRQTTRRDLTTTGVETDVACVIKGRGRDPSLALGMTKMYPRSPIATSGSTEVCGIQRENAGSASAESGSPRRVRPMAD